MNSKKSKKPKKVWLWSIVAKTKRQFDADHAERIFKESPRYSGWEPYTNQDQKDGTDNSTDSGDSKGRHDESINPPTK